MARFLVVVDYLGKSDDPKDETRVLIKAQSIEEAEDEGTAIACAFSRQRHSFICGLVEVVHARAARTAEGGA